MATRWFYRQGGKEYGPVSAALLTQLADVGRLEPTDLVWAENTNQRMPARRIKGLFRSAQPQEPPRPAAASEFAASKPRAKSRSLLWLGGSGVVVVLIAVALFAGWYMGQRDQNRRVTDNVPQMPAKSGAEATPKTEWAIVTDAMKECRTGKELFDDADDPSTPSRVRKAREAQEHLERAKNMVTGLPKELQQLIGWRIEMIVEFRAGRAAEAEARLLKEHSNLLKLIDANRNYGMAKIASDMLEANFPKLEAKYKK